MATLVVGSPPPNPDLRGEVVEGHAHHDARAVVLGTVSFDLSRDSSGTHDRWQYDAGTARLSMDRRFRSTAVVSGFGQLRMYIGTLVHEALDPRARGSLDDPGFVTARLFGWLLPAPTSSPSPARPSQHSVGP